MFDIGDRVKFNTAMQMTSLIWGPKTKKAMKESKGIGTVVDLNVASDNQGGLIPMYSVKWTEEYTREYPSFMLAKVYDKK